MARCTRPILTILFRRPRANANFPTDFPAEIPTDPARALTRACITLRVVHHKQTRAATATTLLRAAEDVGMKRHTTMWIALVCAMLPAASARADVVTDWNNAALSAIRENKTPPPQASRALAMLHAAIYDAVNGIARTYDPYLVRSDAPASASRVAAASAAARSVLIALFPSNVAAYDALHTLTLQRLVDSPQKRHGIEWGERVAHEILSWRSTDNSDSIVTPPSQTTPGFWQRTPPTFASYLLPQWGWVAPFAIPSGSLMRPPGPPALSSVDWAADYNEVKMLGAAVGSSRTAEEDAIALFWADGGGTETPPGHWNRIAQQVSAVRGGTVEENARLFAILNIAMADAAICAWDAKYAYDFWRPVTAIRNGDLDGNPGTVADPVWNSFIVTPPFPEYVSGHSTFSGAAAIVLAMFYGTDNISFTIGSDGLPNVTRPFASFSAAANEAAMSRLYGGIHFRSAIQDGLDAGVEIGQWTYSHYMTPKSDRSRK